MNLLIFKYSILTNKILFNKDKLQLKNKMNILYHKIF